jgi:hypothetical protein
MSRRKDQRAVQDRSTRHAGVPDVAEQARFGARAVLAGVAIGLVAVPFALLLLMVDSRWTPLLRIDHGARDALHALAVDEAGFVTALKVVSTVGSASVYVPLFAALTAWLAWRGLGRLAMFVAVCRSKRAPRFRVSRFFVNTSPA